MGRFEKALVAVFLTVCAGLMATILLTWPKDYLRNLSIEVHLVRGTPGVQGDEVHDRLVGVVRNKGPLTVISMSATFSLLDKRGVQVAGRSELIAHDLPFGDNNTPVRPHSAKEFRCPISGVPKDWTGKIVSTIDQVTLE
jgi:hypothetical protein